MVSTLPIRQSDVLSIPRGMDLLDTPTLNKGTAFTEEERTQFGLQGLLPPHVETLDEQAVRAYEAFQRKDDDLERHIYLRALQDTNEVLFYRLIVDHIEEMTPLVYTPTVAVAIEQFSHIYRRPRGLFIPYALRDSIPQLLRNRPNRDVDVIVVTDGERILGIGDQGAGGLGISIGKLSLYTGIGGIHPERTLPIVLDVGTNNNERLNDPEYLGWRHERITGQAYYDFVDQFVQAVKQEFPETCLQWEDFATPHARPILQRYRDQLLTFNDDIQSHSGGRSRSDYRRGQGDWKESEGATDRHARGRFDWNRCCRWPARGNDRRRINGRRGSQPFLGRLTKMASYIPAEMTSLRSRASMPNRRADVSGWPRTFQRTHRPGRRDWDNQCNILIGLSTVGGAFSEPIVREMARKVERPIIFPLSNPTSKSEATAEDLIRWTDGRALVASGSPFAPVDYNGRKITIAQCNNVHIFPAMGLGIVASGARRVTDAMMLAAARALAANSPALKDPSASLLSPLKDSRRVATDIAVAVGIQAQKDGVAPEVSEDELRRRVLKTQWTPAYAPLG